MPAVQRKTGAPHHGAQPAPDPQRSTLDGALPAPAPEPVPAVHPAEGAAVLGGHRVGEPVAAQDGRTGVVGSASPLTAPASSPAAPQSPAVAHALAAVLVSPTVPAVVSAGLLEGGRLLDSPAADGKPVRLADVTEQQGNAAQRVVTAPVYQEFNLGGTSDVKSYRIAFGVGQVLTSEAVAAVDGAQG